MLKHIPTLFTLSIQSIQTGLSTTIKPKNIEFDLFGTIRKAGTSHGRAGAVPRQVMQCLPLYSMMIAMGNPNVHY